MGKRGPQVGAKYRTRTQVLVSSLPLIRVSSVVQVAQVQRFTEQVSQTIRLLEANEYPVCLLSARTRRDLIAMLAGVEDSCIRGISRFEDTQKD